MSNRIYYDFITHFFDNYLINMQHGGRDNTFYEEISAMLRLHKHVGHCAKNFSLQTTATSGTKASSLHFSVLLNGGVIS